MATPESTPAYDPDPADPIELQMLDRMRGILARSSDLAGMFQGVIRQFPVTTVVAQEDDDGNALPTLALYAMGCHLTASKTTGTRYEVNLPCFLEILFNLQNVNADADYMDTIARRAWVVAAACRRVLRANQQDPGPFSPATPNMPVGPLWHLLTFPHYPDDGGGRLAIQFRQSPERLYLGSVSFALTVHPRTP